MEITRNDGVNVENVIHMIKCAGQNLGLFSVTSTRAMIICHHFKRCIGSAKYDDGLIAAAALSLSAKVNEDDIDKTSIVDYFWRVFKASEEPNVNSEEFKKLSRSVTLMEYFICRMLKFSMHYKLAHEYLVPFLREMHEKNEFKDDWSCFSTVIWKAVNTIYETRRCLDYEASEIATASILFACIGCDIDFTPYQGWQQALSISAHREKCKHIFADILLACYK